MKQKYTVLLIASLLLILGITAIRTYKKWHFKKYRANIEHNHNAIRYFVNDSTGFVRLAFAHLENLFANPNEFNLNAYLLEAGTI